MAILLLFKQGDGGAELSLMGGDTGFQLAGQGWSPAVATPVHMGDPAPINEAIHLILKHSSHNAIATKMQALHEIQVLADRYINDPTQETPVWLHARMANETGERRALVYSISVQYKASWFGEPATAIDIPLVLSVVRGPYWEAPVARVLPDGAPAAAACVVYDYTAAGDAVGAHNIVGDVGARIRFTETKENNLELSEYWMGIRSADKHGSTGISNFIPIWECEAGTLSTDAATAGDATASDGTHVLVSESGVDWDDGSFHNVSLINLDVITANQADQYGNYLWLLRGHATSNDIWEVRLKYYLGSANANITKDPVEINGVTMGGWSFYEMGITPISLHNTQIIIDADYETNTIDHYRVQVQARRTTDSSGTLKLDCLCLIPVDEGFLKITTPQGAFTVSEMFGQSPKGEVAVIRSDYSNDEILGWSTVSSIENFILPPGDGRIYCVYTAAPGDITDTIIFNDGDTGRYYERWLSLRGSE